MFILSQQLTVGAQTDHIMIMNILIGSLAPQMQYL